MAPAERTELDLWPYEEARRLAERVGNYPPERAVIFESGFGPSGLPHLGTMGEVLRPAYVQHAFQVLGQVLGETDATNAAYRRQSRLIVFIDDMDGLRKVPESIPNREATMAFLGQPVSRIPDPFGECHPNFAAHMIGLLEKFLEPVEVELRVDALERDVCERPLRRRAETDPGEARRDNPDRRADAARGESRRMVARDAALSSVRANQLDPGDRVSS